MYIEKRVRVDRYPRRRRGRAETGKRQNRGLRSGGKKFPSSHIIEENLGMLKVDQGTTKLHLVKTGRPPFHPLMFRSGTMHQILRLRVSLLLLSAVALLRATNAVEIPILTLDGGHRHDSKWPSISEEHAKLLLERRMKSADSSSLGSLDDETVEYLNEFGGRQSSLFGIRGKAKASQKGLVFLEGVNGPAGMLISNRCGSRADRIVCRMVTSLASQEPLPRRLGCPRFVHGPSELGVTGISSRHVLSV